MVEDALQETADDIIQAAIDNYDTAIPGETYERTGNLGLGWDTLPVHDKANGEIEITIFNNVVEETGRQRFYAGLVQGDEQTERHAGAGWRKIEDIAKDFSHVQAVRVREAIRKAANS